MTENTHTTLLFVDILGFASLTMDSRRRLVRSRKGDIETIATSDMANRANQFSSAIERFLYQERLNGVVHGMVFSDCAFVELGSFHRAAFGAARLMQELMMQHLPVRMGIGRGTFYAECPFVFQRNGERIKYFRAAWQNACAIAGCPNALVHDMRRSAVRTFERAGVPRSVAMSIVGHKTESIYRRYAIVDEKMQREAATRLDAWMRSNESNQRTHVVRSFERP